MSEHHFGLGPGHLPDEANEIAQRHGAWLVNYTEPGGEDRHWFACRNTGEPFNSATASAVMADIEAADIEPLDEDDEDLRAERAWGRWSVEDPAGGVWRPSDEANEEIEGADAPAETAIEMATREPNRGEWHA